MLEPDGDILQGREVPLALDGIKLNTSPTDFYPLQSLQLSRFKGEKWELSAELGFEIGDAREELDVLRMDLGVLRQQLVDPAEQRRILRHDPKHHRLQVVIERIDCLGRHPKLESAWQPALNDINPSHTTAQG